MGVPLADDEFASITERSPLVAELREQIGREGPIPFREFMRQALYHPLHGYYATSAAVTSRGGDYVTSPEVHPVFATLVCKQIIEFWRALDRPAVFTIVEAGGGRGLLARDLLLRAQREPGFCDAVRYQLVERAHLVRAAQQPSREAPVPAHTIRRDLPDHELGESEHRRNRQEQSPGGGKRVRSVSVRPELPGEQQDDEEVEDQRRTVQADGSASLNEESATAGCRCGPEQLAQCGARHAVTIRKSARCLIERPTRALSKAPLALWSSRLSLLPPANSAAPDVTHSDTPVSSSTIRPISSANVCFENSRNRSERRKSRAASR